MSAKLESAVNVAMLITCITVVASLGGRIWTSKRPPERLEAFKVGEKLPTFEGVDLKRAAQSLVMVLRHDCHFCNESVPFYKQLSAKVSGTSGPARSQLVVIAPDSRDSIERFVLGNALKVASIVTLSPQRFRDVRVPGTPALLLTDQTGVIQHIWLGRLDSVGEAEVLSSLHFGS